MMTTCCWRSACGARFAPSAGRARCRQARRRSGEPWRCWSLAVASGGKFPASRWAPVGVAGQGRRSLDAAAETATILPAQFFQPPECGPYGYGPGSGPRRLMVAVLVDAVRSCVEPARTAERRAQQRRDRAWLTSETQARLFAFRRICQVLELD